MKPTVLFCTGLSGSGKSYFIKNILPKGAFYNLKSATTRPMREGEKNGREYYFCNEVYFELEKFATKLFVNEQFWKPGDPKWLYGITENEIKAHWGQNLTYDVIQPRYVRQMIDWFNNNDPYKTYDFRIAWFIPTMDNFVTAAKRQNMPHDLDVRRANTCNAQDFRDANLTVDHIVISNPQQLAMDDRLREFINSTGQHIK